ncbi:amidohydrolase family protein [Amycolatopsis ultiminotia]|uniref:Amidohydrolase family protein n=1 Tax=Amycolatopsis ultiminotia TaxID=543629 RepID=A0ABP6XIT2_9PSEU
MTPSRVDGRRKLSPHSKRDIQALPSGKDASYLITGAYLLTMDETLGSLDGGDVLVEHGLVTAVGADLAQLVSPSTTVIDGRGMIVLPGFQDAHRHCWQSQFRRMFSDTEITGYMKACHDLLAPAYSTDDIHLAGRLSAWGAVDAGITTVMDFMHNTRTVDYAVAGAQAFEDAGVRCVHTMGPPSKGSWDRRWPHNLAEMKERFAGSNLVTVRLGPYGDPELDQPTKTVSRDLIELARSMDLGITVDAVFGDRSSQLLAELASSDHLGPDVALIHCNALTDNAWERIAEADARVILAPTSDTWLGIYDATPPIDAALSHGVRPGLSIDVECSLSTDMFTIMRTVCTVQRMSAHRKAWAEGKAGVGITTRRILEMATVDGARVHGLDHVTGTITPGKQADLIGISAEDINNLPLNDATASVVLGSDARNVKLVMVAGKILKWGRTLIGCDVDALRLAVRESRDRLIRDSGLPARPPSAPPRP